MKANSKIIKIGQSIRKQIALERKNRPQHPSIARFDVDLTSPNGDKITHLWLQNQIDPIREGFWPQKEDGSLLLGKNSPVGIILTSRPFGTYKYNIRCYGNLRANEITISSKATYINDIPARDLVITLDGEPQSFRYADIDSLLRKVDEIERELKAKREAEEAARKEAARLKREVEQREAAIAKAKAEEVERLRQEAIRIQEEQRKQEELRRVEIDAIRRLEEQQIVAINHIVEARRSFLTGHGMRYQQIVDMSQTQAKVSHIYDGIPIVIDGGPGTGKTTTFIQRLKFLIEPRLYEHESCKLTKKQVDKLTDPTFIKNNWIFISPSELLAQYLKDAISEEGLANNTANIVPFDKFLNNQLKNYQLTFSNYGTRPAFSPIKSEEELSSSVLISSGPDAVKAFENYVITQVTKIFRNALTVKTAGYGWQKCALGIQRYCQTVEKIKSLKELIRLLNNIQDNEKNNVKSYVEELKESTDLLAYRLCSAILEEEETVRSIGMLFEEWAEEKNTGEIEEIDLTEDEEVQVRYDINDVKSKLFQELKRLLKKIALQQFDPSINPTKRQKDLYDIIKTHIENTLIEEIADLVWFQKNFESLCRGVENILISKIPKLYKAFRKEQLKADSSPYVKDVLAQIVNKKDNRLLHRDEQSLLLGFINNIVNDFRKSSTSRFEASKNQFVEAYKSAVKYVIGMDEASDYSMLDYYCIASFAHYEFSSITLCGDIMQGLGNNGVENWNDLKKWVFPKLDIFPLKTSYRQWPALLDVSRQMYYDDLKIDAPFTSVYNREGEEPAPLAFISADEREKAKWIAHRINEVCRHFGSNEIPSIAIFINENEDAKDFIDLLKENECMDTFYIDDCTAGYQGRNDSIRVFKISEVKGMEFEAAFFHNIDSKFIKSDKLRRRYLYVGISRAVSHLGATFNSPDNDIIKYFSTESSWKI